MAKYLGVIVLLVGALLLVVAGLTPQTSNLLLLSGLVLVIAGYITHIVLGRQLKA